MNFPKILISLVIYEKLWNPIHLNYQFCNHGILNNCTFESYLIKCVYCVGKVLENQLVNWLLKWRIMIFARMRSSMMGCSTPRDPYCLVQQMRVTQIMNINYGHSDRQTQKERERDTNYEVDFCSFCSVVLGFKMFGFYQFVFALCTLWVKNARLMTASPNWVTQLKLSDIWSPSSYNQLLCFQLNHTPLLWFIGWSQ